MTFLLLAAILLAGLVRLYGVRVVVVRVLNAQGVSESAPWDEIEAGIAHVSEHGRVDVWLLSEIAWANLQAIADRHGLHALHYGDRGSAEAGVGILSREPITDGAQLVGTLANREGRGTRMRPLVTGKTCGVWVTAGHAPPPTSPIARAAYIMRALLRRGVVGCDWNVIPKRMRTLVAKRGRRTYRGIGVVGLVVPRRFRPSVAVGVRVGSDHLAVDVKLLVPVRRRKDYRLAA